MPQYRRLLEGGRTWFFTVNLQERRSALLIEQVSSLRDVVGRVRRKYPFMINAWVVLPDHMHCVWTLPDQDGDFSLRWRLIKTGFAKQLPRQESIRESRLRRGERGVWQRRFWEHQIRNEQDYSNHVEYCYINPVKHGYVSAVKEWPYSSFHRDVWKGLFAEDWAGPVGDVTLEWE